MKCKLTEKKNMTVMLAVGLAMIVIGALSGYLLPQEAHLATRLAGFVTGGGTAFSVMAAFVLIRRKIVGEARARDGELTMNDERGITVAYKAQNVAAIAAIAALIAMTVAALVRDDTFFMMLGSMLLCAVALIKCAAWLVYNKKM